MSRRLVEPRLRRLEVSRRNRVAVMWRHRDEPDEAAFQRWQEANPTLSMSTVDLRVIVVRWSRRSEPVAP